MNTEQRRTRQDVIDETTERMEAIALLKLRRPYLPDTKIAKELGLDRSTVSRLWLEYTQDRWVPLLRKISRTSPDGTPCQFTEDEVKAAGEMLRWFNGVRDNTSTSTVCRADAARNREQEERRWIHIDRDGCVSNTVCRIKGYGTESGSACHIVIEAKTENSTPVYTVVDATVPTVRISAPEGKVTITAFLVKNIVNDGAVIAEATADTHVTSGYEGYVALDLRPCEPYSYNPEGRTPTGTAKRHLRLLKRRDK